MPEPTTIHGDLEVKGDLKQVENIIETDSNLRLERGSVSYSQNDIDPPESDGWDDRDFVQSDVDFDENFSDTPTVLLAGGNDEFARMDRGRIMALDIDQSGFKFAYVHYASDTSGSPDRTVQWIAIGQS